MEQETRELLAYSILAAIFIVPAIWIPLWLRKRKVEEVRRYSARRRKER